MPTILECPQCETRFRISKLAPRVDCPSCNLNFKPNVARPQPAKSSSSIDLQQMAAELADGTKKRARPPRRLKTETSKYPTMPTRVTRKEPAVQPPALATPPPPSPPTNKIVSPQFSTTQATGVDITAAPPSPYRKRRGKKHRIWLTLFTVVMAAAAIGGLFAIVATLGKPEPEPEKTELVDVDTKDADEKKEDAIDKAIVSEDPEPKQPVVPPVDETPVFFTDVRKSELVWQKLNSYLVRLEIQTPVSTRTQTGLIVDSRGWVLTSLNGLKDAGKVTVTVAAKSLNDRPPYRELSDEARGIIASDSDLDLAIIAINRIQVNNIADVPFYDMDDIVRAQRLLIARTPPPGHQRWLAECQVEKRGKAAGLEPTIAKAIESSGMSLEQRYIIFPPRLKSNLNAFMAGSPLVDLSGKIMAINTATMVDGKVLAIPANVAQQFIQSVPNPAPQPKPFARQTDLLRQTVTESDPSSADGKTTAPVELTLDQHFGALVAKLDGVLTTARDTDWTAESVEEYQAMQRVPEYILEIEQWLADNFQFAEDAETQREVLEEKIKELGDSLSADLDVDEMKAGKGNEFFAEHVNEANPWFMAFVRVDKDLFNSPRIGGSETVVLNLLGTDKKLVALLNSDVRIFRRNRWLLFLGRLSSKGNVKHEGTEMQVVEVMSAYQMSTR